MADVPLHIRSWRKPGKELMGLLGWKLSDNWGNYGVYGWGLGIWHTKTPVQWPKGAVEHDLVVKVGPFGAMARKVTEQEAKT